MEKWPEGNVEDFRPDGLRGGCAWCGGPVSDSLWSAFFRTHYCSWRCYAADTAENLVCCAFSGLLVFVVTFGDLYMSFYLTNAASFVILLAASFVVFVLFPVMLLRLGLNARNEVPQRA